jgi:DNA polymerase-4
MPDEGEAFIANLAVARFHGVGPVTARKRHVLRIETGSDLRRQTLDFLRHHFGESGDWCYELARDQDEWSVLPGRGRKSAGSETTFPEDLTDPGRIEAGVIAMADEVWTWCKISTLSRSMETSFCWRWDLQDRGYSNEKIFFQSFFILMTVQFFCFASA